MSKYFSHLALYGSQKYEAKTISKYNLIPCKDGGGKFNCGSSTVERGNWIQRKQDVAIRKFIEWAMDKNTES